MNNKKFFRVSAKDFAKIPGSPVAYWVGEKFTDMFKGDAISTIADTRSGMSTTDNIRFLRFWYEIDIDCACFTCESLEDASNMSKKWFPYNKGGSFRKWYGNKEFVVNWGRNGEEIKYWVTHNPQDPKTKSWSRRIFSTDKFFKKGLTWSDVSTGAFSARHIENGYIFDSCAPMMFCNEEFMKCMLAYINTNMFAYLLKFLCPTIHYNCGSLSSAPCPSEERLRDEYVAEIVDENISLSRADWDSFETSWDFKCHPLVRLARKGSDM